LTISGVNVRLIQGSPHELLHVDSQNHKMGPACRDCAPACRVTGIK